MTDDEAVVEAVMKHITAESQRTGPLACSDDVAYGELIAGMKTLKVMLAAAAEASGDVTKADPTISAMDSMLDAVSAVRNIGANR